MLSAFLFEIVFLSGLSARFRQAVILDQLFHCVHGLGGLHPEVWEEAPALLIPFLKTESGAKETGQAGMGEIEGEITANEEYTRGRAAHKKGVRRSAEVLND